MLRNTKCGGAGNREVKNLESKATRRRCSWHKLGYVQGWHLDFKIAAAFNLL